MNSIRHVGPFLSKHHILCQTIASRALYVQGAYKHKQNKSFLTNREEPVKLSQANNCKLWVRHKFLDARDPEHEKKEKMLISESGKVFDKAAKKKKDKETYLRAVQTYLKHQGVQRRGHVEFIYAAVEYMDEFKVNRDIESYRQIIDLFPKKKMIPKSVWEIEFMHYPKQQQCCIDILEKMEENGVVPDDRMGFQLREIFGTEGHVFRKYRRMMYWMPKFKHLNPYPVPHEVPDCPIELAKLALKRMSVDFKNTISVFQCENLDAETTLDKTFIVSAQSPSQEELLLQHPPDRPLIVEGGFNVWLRQHGLVYFVLKSDETSTYKTFHQKDIEMDEDDTNFDWDLFSFKEKPESQLVKQPTIHEQEDGTILSMCITGTGSKDSLASWIKFLQQRTPILSEIPVIFSLRTPETGIEMYKMDGHNSQLKNA